MRPSAHGRWIGQVRRVFAVRRGLLGRITGGDVLTGLLPAVKAVEAGGRQPIGQDGKGLAAWMTDSASHPDPVVASVVCLLAPLAMADDGIVATKRTPAREQLQWERPHPGSVLSSASCSAIKRITADVRPCH